MGECVHSHMLIILHSIDVVDKVREKATNM